MLRSNEVLEIYRAHLRGERAASIAGRFCVSRETVNAISNGRQHRRITGAPLGSRQRKKLKSGRLAYATVRARAMAVLKVPQKDKQ